MKKGLRNPKTFLFLFHHLANQPYCSQTDIRNWKQTNKYKCVWHFCWYMEAVVCLQDLCGHSHIIRHSKSTHTHTLKLSHLSYLWVLPAFSLCMPTVCLASGLRSGATHMLCSLPSCCTLWMGFMNNWDSMTWVNTRGHAQPNPTTGFGDKSETTFSQHSQGACLT